MRFSLSDKTKTKTLVAAFMALGYEACGGTTGLGALQATEGIDQHNILSLFSPEPPTTVPVRSKSTAITSPVG